MSKFILIFFIFPEANKRFAVCYQIIVILACSVVFDAYKSLIFVFTLQRMMFNDIVLVACAVGSTLWVGMKSGAIKVYCSMTYKPLALARPSGSGSVISMLHSPACHCVLVGLTNDSIMSYNENISSYMHTIPQMELSKHFGNILYLEPIRELIANRVHAGMSIYNPIHCLAAVPSRARSYPIEEQMTYYGHGGEPLASSSRDHKYGLDDYMQENNKRQSTITYELWCGVDKGIINVFDLNKLEKVKLSTFARSRSSYYCAAFSSWLFKFSYFDL